MRMKILIADDEKDIRFLISQYLKEINGNLEIAGVVSGNSGNCQGHANGS